MLTRAPSAARTACDPRLEKSNNNAAGREQAETEMSNTKTIAKNTGWYGLETAISSIVTLFTSVAIARVLGPSKMGYIVYVSLIASMASGLGGLGIPATTRKYMAEFLGMADPGNARYIYFRTLLLQMGLASLATGGVLVWVLRDAKADYRLASVLIVLSIWPSMVNFISAQANVASENLSANLPGSVTSIFVYFVAIAATVVFKWGVNGVGLSLLLMRSADFLVRLIPTLRGVLAWETVQVHPHGLSRRMVAFAWKSVLSMFLALIVWNRSEVFLLKYLCSDIRQIAFYSVAFSMAERLLVSATVFGSAIGATIFAQYGRDRTKLPAITAASFRYLALTSIPLHFITAALAIPILLVLYGKAYQDAAAVVTLAPLLCMPKAFMAPVQSLFESMEKQSFIILSTVLAGIVDMGVAWYLIRGGHGAVGACIGSGAAQVTAIGLLWSAGIVLFGVKLDWAHLAKVLLASAVAACAGYFVARQFVPLAGVLCGGSVSLMVLFALFYLLRVLEAQDRIRFATVNRMLPKPIGGPADRLLLLLIRPEPGSVAAAGRAS